MTNANSVGKRQPSGDGRMFISVIVPFHGPEPFITRCVDSLLADDYPPAQRELIFVDNGGTPPARAAVMQHAEIHLLAESQPGAYAARNRGLQQARGNVIAFTDPDCAVAPDWLGSIAGALSEPSVKIVVGAYLPARRSFTLSALAAYENEKNRYVFESGDQRLYFGYTNNMAVRAELFAELGTFVPRRRGADTLFVRRVTERFGPGVIRYEPRMRVQHLEVDSARDYYRKVFVHSRSNSALREISALRPLNLRERMIAFRRLVDRENHSPAQAAAVFGLLAGGLLVWLAGSLWHGRRAA